MADTSEELLRARIRLELDKAGVSDAKAGLGVIYKALLDSEKQANVTADAIDSINQATQYAADTAQGFLGIWQDVSQGFVQQMGFADSVSARWLKTQQRITNAQMSLGRNATKALQPWQDKLADIMNMLANFIDQHPELLKMGIDIASITVAGATAVNVATRVATTIRTGIEQLRLLNSIQLSGAGRFGVGVGAIAAGSIGGFYGGKAIGNFLTGAGKMDTGYNQQVQQQSGIDVAKNVVKGIASIGLLLAIVIRDVVTQLSNFVSTLKKFVIGLEETLHIIDSKTAESQRAAADKANADFVNGMNKSIGENAKKLNDAIEDAANQLKAAMPGVTLPSANAPGGGFAFGQDVLDNFKQFEQQLEQQDEQFRDEQQRAQHEFASQLLEEQTDFDRAQAQAADQYHKAAHEADVQYQAESIQAEADFNDNRLREQADFQLAQERAQQDHEDRLHDAASRLDALAVIEEQRNYTKDSSRAKDDFARQQSQEKDNFKKEQDRRADNFKAQMKQMDDQFQEQQRQAEADFRFQQNRERDHFRTQMADQEAQYMMQRRMAIEQYRVQIEAQLAYQNMSEEQIHDYYTNLQKQLQDFLSGSQPSSAGGGSAGSSGSGGGGPYGEHLTSGEDPRDDPDLRKAWLSDVTHGYFKGTFDDWLRAHGYIMMAGGYTGGGGARLTHPGEFMLTAGTTKMLEQRAGGRLTQGSVIGLAQGSRGGLNVTNVFNDVGQHPIGALQQMVHDVMVDILQDYVGSAA